MQRIGLIKEILQTNKLNTATVFLFHGSGDSGTGFLETLKYYMQDLAFPHIKLVIPTAPVQPYTLVDGMHSNVWFDREDLNISAPDKDESIDAIGVQVKELIEKEVKRGVPLNRIVVGGFSQGGALSMHTAYRWIPELAGAFVLSSFLNEGSAVYRHLGKGGKPQVPLLMCHGDADALVPIEWGKKTFRELQKLGVDGEFHTIEDVDHEVNEEMLKMVFEWVEKRLPPL